MAFFLRMIDRNRQILTNLSTYLFLSTASFFETICCDDSFSHSVQLIQFFFSNFFFVYFFCARFFFYVKFLAPHRKSRHVRQAVNIENDDEIKSNYKTGLACLVICVVDAISLNLMSIGILESYKVGACNIIPAVPTTTAIVKIHKNKRSSTIATNFQSSFTCVRSVGAMDGSQRHERECGRKKIGNELEFFLGGFGIQRGCFCFVLEKHFFCHKKLPFLVLVVETKRKVSLLELIDELLWLFRQTRDKTFKKES